MKWTAFPSAWKGTAGIDEPSSLEIKTLQGMFVELIVA